MCRTIQITLIAVLDSGSFHDIMLLALITRFQVYPQFIHTKGKQNYGPFVVEVLNYQQYPAMTSTMVKIQKRVGFLSPKRPRLSVSLSKKRFRF